MDSTSSGQIRGRGRNKRVWTPGEDEKLVECLVELCVSGKVKCDNGFKPGAFLQVEKMLEEKLPNNFKKQFNAIMDMLTHGSGFLGTMKRKWFYVIKMYLKKLPNLNRLDILKLSQIIMSDPMKVKLLFNLDEDLKVEWAKQLLQTP
ncbi:hypothetical protein AAG906_016660 [Vitis piasezkii]